MLKYYIFSVFCLQLKHHFQSSISFSYTKNVWKPLGTLSLVSALTTGVGSIVLASHITNSDFFVSQLQTNDIMYPSSSEVALSFGWQNTSPAHLVAPKSIQPRSFSSQRSYFQKPSKYILSYPAFVGGSFFWNLDIQAYLFLYPM